MPYEIETKDGIVVRGIPDDVQPTDPRIRQKVEGIRSQMKSAADTKRTQQAGAMALEGTSALEKGVIGAGKAVSDLWQGTKQLVGIADTKEVEETRARDSALMDTTAGQVGHFAGNVGMAIPTMFVPGANTYMGAALAGGALGGLQPVGEDESRGLNTALGAAGGAVGQGIGNTIGRVLRPVQSTLPKVEADLAQDALKRGIPLRASQVTGSRPLQVTESVMENLPFTAGSQLGIKQAQQQAFNRAVGKTFGENVDAITPEVAGNARTRIGQSFTELSARNHAAVGDDVLTKLGSIVDEANKFGTSDASKVVSNYADEILSKVDQTGQLAGRAYRKLDSDMGRTMRSTSNGDVRHAVGQVRDVLREAMDNSISAADQGAWRDARRQYANLMTVAPLAARSETGDVSGRTLLSAANRANKGAQFGGQSELADLGRIGKAFVADQIPNSGTAQRLAAQGLLTGGGALVGGGASLVTGQNPLEGMAIGAGVTAGGLLSPRVFQALMNSKAGQAYLSQGLVRLTTQQQALLNAAGRATAGGLLGQAVQQ